MRAYLRHAAALAVILAGIGALPNQSAMAQGGQCRPTDECVPEPGCIICKDEKCPIPGGEVHHCQYACGGASCPSA